MKFTQIDPSIGSIKLEMLCQQQGCNQDLLDRSMYLNLNCTRWGPQTIAKLVHITPMSLWFMDVYGTYNYSIHGVYKPSNITGGPHLVPSGYD